MATERRTNDATDGPGTGDVDATELNATQRRILAYLRSEAGRRTYFKSRRIATELDLTAREVGCNMRALLDGDYDVRVEKWGYSSSTTWKVTR